MAADFVPHRSRIIYTARPVVRFGPVAEVKTGWKCACGSNRVSGTGTTVDYVTDALLAKAACVACGVEVGELRAMPKRGTQATYGDVSFMWAAKPDEETG